MRILTVLVIILLLMGVLAFNPTEAVPPLPPRATFTTAPTPDPDATPILTEPPPAYPPPYPAPSNEERRTKNDEEERDPPPDSSLIAHLSSFLRGLFGSR